MQMIAEFFDNIDVDLFDNMPIQLECDVPECDLGDGGARWRTPVLSEENALKYLESHETHAHGPRNYSSELQRGGIQWGCSRKEAYKVWWKTGVVPDFKVPAWSYPFSSLEEIPRPTLSGRCCREHFNLFKMKWDVYVRYYGKVAKTEDDIKDQLFSCLSKGIREHVYVQVGPEIHNTTVEEMLLMVEFFAVRKGEQATGVTHSAVVSTTHATEPEEVSVMVGVQENVETTVLIPEISSSQTRMGGAEVQSSGVHLQQGHNLPADVGVGGTPEGEAEVVPGDVKRPVLPRNSSVKQFNTFKLDWTEYAQIFRSRCREQQGEEEYMLNQYMVNYMLNYELLASTPDTVENTVSKAMGC